MAKTFRVNRRKNAAFRQLHDLNLTCCDNGCLLRHGLRNIKRIIRRQRNLLYEKQYNEQNYFLAKLLEVKITPMGRRKITYKTPSLGEVCKTAFLKVYGISKHKIECLLKCHYDENRIFSTKAIFKHKQVACMRRKMPFTIF